MLSACAPPVLASAAPVPTLEPPPPAVAVVARPDRPADPVQGWAAALRIQIMHAVAVLRRKMPKGTLVKLSFTVTGTGQLESIRGEGKPRAVEQIVAAVRGLGHVPVPPDHEAHAVAVPIRVVK